MDERYILILVCVCSSIIAVTGNTKCPGGLTTIVEGLADDGVLSTEKYSYSEKINSTHFRVCKCAAKPCLKKCCGRGELMISEHCENAPMDFPDFIARTGSHDSSDFNLIYGNGCPANYFTRFYPDDYTNVNYYIRTNGSISIYFDMEMRQVDDFCLEWNLRQGNNSGKPPALLICIPKDYQSGIYEYPLGMTLSLPFLAVTLIVYSFRELRSTYSKNLTSHIGSLLSAYLSVIIVEVSKQSIPEGLCVGLGFVRQFFFLSSFFWLNAMCFDLWWSLSAWSDYTAHCKEKERRKQSIYSACGWGFPALVVIITVIMQFSPVPETLIKPGIGFPNCFLQDGRPFYAYFYGPVIFIFCTDVTLFILSAIRFITNKKKMKLASVQEKIYIHGTKTRYFLLLKIFVMMSVNWIIDPFSWIFESSFWTWLFIHLSITLQAVGIFFIFVWKADVKNIILSKFRKRSYAQMTTISLLQPPPPPQNIALRGVTTAETTSC